MPASKSPNHAMERTATRCSVRVFHDENLFAASHHRSRWPSLIEFSLDLAQAHTLQENSCLTT